MPETNTQGEFAPEHQAMIDAAAGWFRDIDAAEILRRDAAHTPVYEFLPRLAELGLMRAFIPEAHGGLAVPWSVYCRIQEVLAYRYQAIAAILNRVMCFGVLPLIRFGTASQQARLLPPLLDGKALTALALSEPAAGSDARAVQTRAERAPSGWRVRGRKTWISDADQATHLQTLCRLATERPRRFITLLVPRHAQGVSMTLIPKLGNHYMPSYDIAYDDVFVSDDDVLGVADQGFDCVTATLKFSRTSLSAMLLGSANAVLDIAIHHAREREQFGQPLTEFQVIRHKLVDMRIEIEKARRIVYEFARLVDANEDTTTVGAIAKIAASEMFQFVTDQGMQILASAGYSTASLMQMHWRNARLYSFGEGSNEIQREIIGRDMGLRNTQRGLGTGG